MAKTLQERFIAALEARGETLVKSTAKYHVYTRNHVYPRKDMPRQWYFYIGKSGALRSGATVDASYPVQEVIRKLLLEIMP